MITAAHVITMSDSWTVWNVVRRIVENCKVAALISIHGDPPPLCRFYITSPTLGPTSPAQNTSWYHFMSAHTGQHFTSNSCCHGLRLGWESRVPINILVTTRKCLASNLIKLNPAQEGVLKGFEFIVLGFWTLALISNQNTLTSKLALVIFS